MMKKLLLIVIMLTAGFTYAQTPVSWNELQANMDEWAEGPVSLLLTSEEKEIFEKLKSPEEKMQFIKIFWSRRDPLLRTRVNEFKKEFYKRVDHANENYGERDVAGWNTARGQAYVLFGPPSRVDHQTIPESSRPALLWVYDNLPANAIPKNEALMFVWRDFKYVLAPPNPEPGDTIAAQQAAIDRSFRYQTIPTVVEQAFNEVAQKNVVDEEKDYDELLFSVRATEKFGITDLQFETNLQQTQPVQVQVSIPSGAAPVYDAGERVFAELIFTQELRQDGKVVAQNEHSESFAWSSEAFDDLDQINVKLPPLQAPAGQYELHVTVQDRISSVAETKTIPVKTQ
jgi:GWxTD domain-containing protein